MGFFRKILSIRSILGLVALSMTSCLWAKDAQKVHIGISLPTLRDIGWVRYRDSFDALGKKLAKEKNYTVSIQTGDQDASQQASQVENLLSQGINVLILAPQDAAAAASLVEKAHKVGVKVVSLDRLILDSNVDFYVSFDNEKVGELQGQYLTKLVPKGNYIVLSGAPTDNNSKLFRDGAMKYITPLVKSKDVKVVMDQPIDDWQPSVAQRLVENALTANKNNVRAILAPNDNTAGGVIQALIAQKLAGKVIVTGQDAEISALKRIVNGQQAMTVFKDQRALAQKAMDAAIDLALDKKPASNATVDNGKLKVPSMLINPVVVDKNNLDNVLIKSNYVSKEDVYK